MLDLFLRRTDESLYPGSRLCNGWSPCIKRVSVREVRGVSWSHCIVTWRKSQCVTLLYCKVESRISRYSAFATAFCFWVLCQVDELFTALNPSLLATTMITTIAAAQSVTASVSSPGVPPCSLITTVRVELWVGSTAARLNF